MRPIPDPEPSSADEYWRQFLSTGAADFEKWGRRLFRRLPQSPRCKACSAPFEGIGAPVVKILFGKRQSKFDPRYCSQCTDLMHKYPGGAQIEITMLFADVRGSTTLAEKTSPAEFSEIIDRFYKATTRVLLDADALIDRLIGDEVVGMYVPGLAGPHHARRAIDSAQELLRVTGHADPEGPWIPVGAGVHTGVSYVGTVGSKSGAIDVTALGDVPNVAARLASLAAPGEVIVSKHACEEAGLETRELEHHELSLKGRTQPVASTVLRIARQ
jgi:adenylate cyclase